MLPLRAVGPSQIRPLARPFVKARGAILRWALDRSAVRADALTGAHLPPALYCDRCFVDGQFQQAIGIALESRRLDKLEEAITRSNDVAGILDYATKVSQSLCLFYVCLRGEWGAGGEKTVGNEKGAPRGCRAAPPCLGRRRVLRHIVGCLGAARWGDGPTFFGVSDCCMCV